jgi:hypothetical protein
MQATGRAGRFADNFRSRRIIVIDLREKPIHFNLSFFRGFKTLTATDTGHFAVFSFDSALVGGTAVNVRPGIRGNKLYEVPGADIDTFSATHTKIIVYISKAVNYFYRVERAGAGTRGQAQAPVGTFLRATGDK